MITCEINTDLTTSIIYIEKDDRHCCTISADTLENYSLRLPYLIVFLKNEKSCSSFVTLSLCVSMYFQTGESMRIV